jgi:hypothetical protein
MLQTFLHILYEAFMSIFYAVASINLLNPSEMTVSFNLDILSQFLYHEQFVIQIKVLDIKC